MFQIRALSASLSELSESRTLAERRASAAEEKLRLFVIRHGARSTDDSFSTGFASPSVASPRADRSAVFEAELKVSVAADTEAKDAAKVASYKSSKTEEIRKLSNALEVARARGEALARELASARQEHDAFVRGMSCEILSLSFVIGWLCF